MKRTFVLAVIMAMVLVCSMQAHAALQNLGTDSLGNRLIYDTDLDITWYDFSNSSNTWTNQWLWADALSVTFGSNIYTDWRLPLTTQPDSSCTNYDPNGFNFPGGFQGKWYGFNCTGSEMGHLYYTELGNAAGGPLANTGDFQHLLAGGYWSNTQFATYCSPSYPFCSWDNAWYVHYDSGFQNTFSKDGNAYGLAVRPGLAVVPEPVSSILFVIGGASLGIRRFWKRSNHNISDGGSAL